MAEVSHTKQGEPKSRILYQILATMCVVALIPIGGLWYISIYKSRQDWTINIQQSLINNAESLSRSVDDWTTMNLRVLEQSAKTPAIKSMDVTTQNPVLKSIADTYNWVYLAFTVLPDGQNLGRSDDKPPKYYGDREYFKQVRLGGKIGEQVLLGKTSGKPAFILSKPIRDDRARLLGVIAIAMSLEDLSKTVTKTKIGKTGFAILLDKENRLIAHGKGEVSSELQDFSNHPALQPAISQKGSIVFDENGKKIVAYTKKTLRGWTLIAQQDYQEAYRAADATRRNAIILLVLTLVTVLTIAYFLAHRLSQPIRNLTTIADEISRGNLSAKIIETQRNDEIGALASAIERMGVSLQMAFDRLRKR